jgi:hypothetical protein
MSKYEVSIMFSETYEADSEFEAEQQAISYIESQGLLSTELVEEEDEATND